MNCYQCNSDQLELAPLWPYERESNKAGNVVMRQCQNCGLEQNHHGHDETLTNTKASEDAHASDVSTGRVWDSNPKTPTRLRAE